MQDLGTLTGTGQSFATGINNSGEVVGYANIGPGDGGNNHAVLWSDGSIQDLGTLGGPLADYSLAYGINDSGQVVGFSQIDASQGTGSPFIYSNGVMQDLNSLIDPASGWTLENAYAINDSGQIVGNGTNALGQQDAFLLTPVPEPVTLLPTALCLLILRRRR